ncbi:MAG TPA: alpha-E domain-containing protein [Chthonomonadaceae bacterium]|nr:alpha-E domain-containing protein [Chthonomonadaceae bacterium]
MLCRDADACYWIGRYVERAEATARMVDVHYHAALESALPAGQGSFEESELRPMRWQSLLAISGSADAFYKRYGAENDRDVLHFFAFDLENSNSILSTWKYARENARSIRELLASEMWETLNVSWLQLKEWNTERVLAGVPHEFFQMVKDASHLFQGILNRTMLMGETRDWLDTGRFLERACQTARLLDVKYHDLLPAYAPADSRPTGTENGSGPYGVGGPLDMHGWIAVLKSVSAFEMYRKTHRDGIRPAQIVEFLVLNPQFPASVRHGIGRVEGCLRRISGNRGDEAINEPERLIGRLRADLTYTRPEEIIADGLHEFLDGVQRRCAAVGHAITRTYLSY